MTLRTDDPEWPEAMRPRSATTASIDLARFRARIREELQAAVARACNEFPEWRDAGRLSAAMNGEVDNYRHLGIYLPPEVEARWAVAATDFNYLSALAAQVAREWADEFDFDANALLHMAMRRGKRARERLELERREVARDGA